MNVRTSVLRNWALLALGTFAFAACDDKTVIDPIVDAIVVTITPPSASLTVGQSATFTAQVLGGPNGTVRTATFSSTTPAVATVNASTGVVTAVAPGTTTIIATSTADATARASAQVNVTGTPPSTVTLTVAPSAPTIQVGQTVQLVGVVNGSTNTTVNYQSATPGVASVSNSGLVTGVSAGQAVITATAAADPNVRQLITVTVTAVPPGPPVAITITPTTASVGIGRTVQFVGTVTGSTNTAVTYTSGTPGVATIDANTGVATGVSAGVTVITARSVADPTKSITATLTVLSTTAPSVSIQSVTATPAAPAGAPPVTVGVGSQIGTGSALGTSTMNVLMNVSAGSETNIARVEARLNGVPGCTQTFNPPLAPTQGVAQINCPLNTAQLTNGAPTFPNGTYTLTAVAIDASNAVVATATYGSLILNNANTVAGVVTWDNSLNDTDNDPDATTDVGAGGAVWYGGAATVALTPAIFQGNAISTVRVAVDVNCNGVADGGEANRAVTISGGTGSVTFSEALAQGAAPTPGIDDLEDATVCFAVYDARDAGGASVTLPANTATGGVISPATTLQPAVVPGQNQFRVDNVQPVFTLPLGTACPGVNTLGNCPTATIAANGAYAGTGSTFTTGNVTNSLAADAAGVSSGAGAPAVSVRFVAVQASTLPAAPTQAQYAAAVATGTEITTASQLPESTVSNEFYTLVVEAKDALGNVAYAEAGDFGVDLTLPTLIIQTVPVAASAANNSTNPVDEINVNITDTFSGPRSVRARITIHSVLEADADAGTEIQCWSIATGAFVALPGSGVCPTADLAVTDQPATTNETAVVTIPTPAQAEGLMVIEVWSVDRAGNQSTDMVTRTVLIDTTIPTGTIDSYTVVNATSSVSLNGTIMENVDTDYFDTRYRFPTLNSIPTQVPFTAPTDVDSYGLPLTGVLTVTGQNTVLIRQLDESAIAPGIFDIPDGIGFGVTDVAGNFGTIIQPIGGWPAGNGTGLAYNDVTGTTGTFDLDVGQGASANAITLDRSAGPTSTNLSAIIGVTAATTASPLSIVYFYYQHPSTDGVSGTADDFLVLLGSDTSADVFTGAPPTSDRTFTYTFPVTATVGNPFPIDSFTYPVVAIGVDAQGDGIVSDKPTVRIQP